MDDLGRRCHHGNHDGAKIYLDYLSVPIDLQSLMKVLLIAELVKLVLIGANSSNSEVSSHT